MADDLNEDRMRGHATARYWGAECKDCVAERRLRQEAKQANGGERRRNEGGKSESDTGFEYSGNWADRAFELGQTRSDRCEDHRRRHRDAIKALSVPYVDLDVIGQVRDRENPTGPLGGLGPLPKPHVRKEVVTDLEVFGFGMGDADILTILDGMKEKRVAVIEAGTGTGKSTFMPFRLMSPPREAAFRPTQAGQIVVTEPRRQATKDVARFVGEALVFGHDSRICKAHIGPGFPVGYQVSDDRNWDSACDLIYVTDGTMINWVRDGSLARIGLVIVDEAHERSANIDIILAQLREKIQEYRHLRVMITSATIDRDFFIEYFGGSTQVFHHIVPEKKSFGYGVPLFVGLDISSSTIRQGLTLAREVEPITFPGWSGFGPEHADFPADDLARETAKYAELRRGKEIPKERWPIEMPRALAEQVVAIAEATEFGDILGFLPTSKMIQKALQNISRRLEGLNLDFDIYPLLSSTDRVTTDAAVAARKRGERRKIVISSNLAETSLTVSGVRFVVDSGLICRSEWDAEIASGGLPVLPHSQAGLRQRWGRVGRDAPGWVFPLYTADQFLSLPRDTPPESTRTNLEEFCTRLISSGLDPEKAVLPGNFQSSGYHPDEFAQEAAENFSQELHRAHSMLRAGGLVDADGDLTDLGREIERYSGSASEALAVALGDRLACLHEVALGIAIVVRGNLYGQKTSILGTRREWAPEWRLRANACHRALVAGCEDDLEIAVRIAALYETAEDGEEWCRTWWVNRGALDAALAQVHEIIRTLSAAMKQEVPRRPFQPLLLPRARTALARAFGEHVYRKEEDGSFTSLADEASATAPSPMLVSPRARVLAFERRQTRRSEGEVDRRISHFVDCVDHEIDLDARNVLSDFDILLKLADTGYGRGGSEPAALDPLAHARANLPIGSVMRFDLEDGQDGLAQILAFKALRDPFLPPEKQISNNVRDDDSGFDPEWDQDGTNEDASDEEDAGWQFLDPRREELNDEVLGEVELLPVPDFTALPTAPPALFSRLEFGGEELMADRAYTVSDYALEEGRCIVLLEPFNEARRSVDPARHDAMRPLDEIEIEFLNMVEDADGHFLRFREIQTHERFDVAAHKFFALDQHTAAQPHDLKPGRTMKAVVVSSDAYCRTITVRPFLRAKFDQAGRAVAANPGQIDRFYNATISSPVNLYNTIDVTLEDIIEPCQVALGAQIDADKVGEDKGIPNEIGSRLQVGFKTIRTDKWSLQPVTPQLEALVKRSGGRLAIKDEEVIALQSIDLALARKVAAIQTNYREKGSWADAVSRIFDASQMIEAKVVFPAADESKKLRDELKAEMTGIGWSPTGNSDVFFDKVTVERIKEMRVRLGHVGQRLTEYKTSMLPEHKSEIFDTMMEKRGQLDKFWEARREAQEQRQQAWRERTSANLERNHAKLAEAESAAARTRARISENEKKRREATSQKWIAIHSEWIDSDVKKLSDIQSQINRIQNWIADDLEKLSR